MEEFWKDSYGVKYSLDKKRLIKCENPDIESYMVRKETEVICDGAFSGCRRLRRIYLFDNLRSIGTNAFNSCSSLEEITIPASVRFIWNGAFYNCKKLFFVNIFHTLYITEDAFEGCPNEYNNDYKPLRYDDDVPDDDDLERDTYYALGGEDYDQFKKDGGNLDYMMEGMGF